MKNAPVQDLSILLEKMAPKRHGGEFVFVPAKKGLDVKPLMSFHEREGESWILKRSEANEFDLSFENSWAWITLEVYSDLNAVGFLARVTNALAQNGIPTNAISALYHDHLFVPYHQSEEAMNVLRKLTQSKDQ